MSVHEWQQFDNRFDEFQKWMNNEYQLSPERMDAIARDSQPGGKYEQHGHINEYIQEFLNDPRIKGASLRRVGFDWKQTPEHELDWSNAKDQWWANLENGHQLGVWGNPGEGYSAALDLPFDPEDPDDPVGEGGFRYPVREKNSGRMTKFPTREHAQRGAEQEYKSLFPIGTDTGGHRSEIDSGVDYEKLINPHRNHGDDEDYSHIFGMLRQAGWEMADIIRLAGDGMSWEDTMAHIDQVLAEGEPYHNHSTLRHPDFDPPRLKPEPAGTPTRLDGPTADGPTHPDIAGYTFQGQNFEPHALIDHLVSAGELSPAALNAPVEEALDQHAGANAIDRYDEASFDSDDFPKVIFRHQLDPEHDADWYSGFNDHTH